MAHATIPDTLVRPDVLLGHGATLPHCEVIGRLRYLTAPEREVLILSRGLAGPRRTLAQAAAILGPSPRKVHAIESVASAKLRHPSTGGCRLHRCQPRLTDVPAGGCRACSVGGVPAQPSRGGVRPGPRRG